ncbi:coiled-coil domain-containing protein 171 [Spea bombifrons]|uniref:coiled-coil domain-containing protein 171 n=1 Tax=Spea bombifrons TaxID=233779 RepID=UPI00234AE628|nr:coiled-coil domain-containing protein 171 [Spea bombifrons]
MAFDMSKKRTPTNMDKKTFKSDQSRNDDKRHGKEEQADPTVITELRSKLNKANSENLELVARHNAELSTYESQFTRLRSEVEKGEAIRQSLEYELAVARKQCSTERLALNEERASSLRTQEQFKAQIEELQKKMFKVEHAFQTAQYNWQDAQKRFESDLQHRDGVIENYKKAEERIMSEKNKLEGILQKQNKTIQDLQQNLQKVATEHSSQTDTLRLQKNELGYSREREERLKMELEEATQRIKRLEESIEAERATHLESKFNSEIIQLRIRDLETSLQVEKATQSQTASDLEMMKKQFIEVEVAYNRERSRAEENSDKLKKTEENYSCVLNKLNEEIEHKNNLITDLTEKLKTGEERFVLMEQELALTKKQQFAVEEDYRSFARELQSLVDTFNVSTQCPSGSYKDQSTHTASAVVLEALKRTLTDYRSCLADASDEIEVTKRACEKMNEELESSKQTIQSLCKSLEGARSDQLSTAKELQHLRSRCTHAESEISRYQMDLEKLQQGWDTEKRRVSEMASEIQKLTRIYLEDAEEKLTFLHGLYQRLIAGCVVIRHPGSMMANFSWSELCTVLQENVDALISDHNQANEKVTHLERVCKNKAEVMENLQQSHQDSLNKLAEQMKAKEEEWQKQRIDLEQRYSALIRDLQARAQKFQSVAEKAKHKIAIFEKTKNQMALENVNIKNVLINSEKDLKSLLAACALMAGALYPLYTRTCSLAAQRDFLQTQVNGSLEVQNEIRVLVQALSATEENTLTKPSRNMKNVFRKCVVAVLAANRLQCLGRSSRSLFTWMDGFMEGPGILISIGGALEKSTISGQKYEQIIAQKALKWFSSSDLLNIVVYSMSELLGVLHKSDASSQSQDHLVKSARNSFSKLMKKLSIEMGKVPESPERCPANVDPDSLVRRLSHGLCEVKSQTASPGLASERPVKKCLSCLKERIFELTQRLHTGEVERRSLRMELSDFKQSLNELRKSLNATERQEEQLQQVKQSKVVPYAKFKVACEELNNALIREQQAQILLSEQSQQLSELNHRLQLHSREEAEKDQTLADAVKSLSEAKMELRRKDQSLHQLNRQVSRLEQDRRLLKENIHNVESALRTAAK